MQLLLQDLLNVDHIRIGLRAEDAEDAIRALSRLLERTGHVVDSFADEVWRREQTFPTGLPTEPFGVAIPHADPEFVRQSAIAIGTLGQPVTFSQMGADASKRLDVYVIFLLAIHESEKQVSLLQQLINTIQQPRLLQALFDCQTPEQVIEVLGDLEEAGKAGASSMSS